MTPVSPYLRRYAYALSTGIVLASAIAATSPALYYDVVDLHLSEGVSAWIFAPALTFATLVSTLLMPLFYLLIGKELWEAISVERGVMARGKALGPALLALGAALGGVLVWHWASAVWQTSEEAGHWREALLPIGSDVVLAYILGRLCFGRGHAALQLLLFVVIMQDILALIVTGLVAPQAPHDSNWRFIWFLLPLIAALAGHHWLTKPALAARASERARRRAGLLLPWLALGLLSWLGIILAGFPPALGFLPLVPAMLHAQRSFGLFALAEGFLHDPLNKITHLLLAPVVGVMFLHGFTRGGLDFGLIAEPTVVITFLAFFVGKPLGILCAFALCRLLQLPLPFAGRRREYAMIALICAVGFTTPVLTMSALLPGGIMQESARLGFVIGFLVLVLAMFAARQWRVERIKSSRASTNRG